MNQDPQPRRHEPAAASVGTVKRLYDRMAPLYDVLNSFYEYSWKRRLRAVMFREARGRLLDVGVGTGCNMPFYPKGQPAVGIDLSPGMLAQARERARALGIDVELRPMDLLRLDFPDDSFDTVAVTFVLLCLPDELQLPALRELARVVAQRPGAAPRLPPGEHASRANLGQGDVGLSPLGLGGPLRPGDGALHRGGRAPGGGPAQLHGRPRDHADAAAGFG